MSRQVPEFTVFSPPKPSFRDAAKRRTRNPYAAAPGVMDSGLASFARAPE